MNSKLFTFLLFFTLMPFVYAVSTGELSSSGQISKETQQALLQLLEENKLTTLSEWSGAAVTELQTSHDFSKAELLELRERSELTLSELRKSRFVDDELLNEKARKPRPEMAEEGALYADFYQESPVLIDYLGDGNQIKEMSFGVVYKYLRDASNKVVPHFVRAQLVSTGAQGHRTSTGEFNIDRRHRYYVSQTYGSRMNYAQFFIGGIALHQTDVEAYPKLGMPASHGCVRHHEYDADAMWNLMGDTLAESDMVNIKVYPFAAPVVLADSSLGTENIGFGEKLNAWLNSSIECTRREVSESCTKSWEAW